jgi:CheY-like chemotaxis protein
MTIHTPRLLITDDDRDFRETLALALSDRGFDTLQAGDGEEALDIVAHQEVHLLLLDMQMPRLSGLDTIERLRGAPGSIGVGWATPTSASTSPIPAKVERGVARVVGTAHPTNSQITLPWILISGALDEQLIARAQAAAVSSVLPKPVRLPHLTTAVAAALEQAYGWRL